MASRAERTQAALGTGARLNVPRKPVHTRDAAAGRTSARRYHAPVRRSLQAATIAALLIAASPALGAEATRSDAAPEFSPDARASLALIEDETFHFDQPGFYAAVEHVRSWGREISTAQAADVDDWCDLLERPADHRGRLVRVCGVVARCKDPYVLSARPELGPLVQIELTRADQPIACTVIVAGAADPAPLGATVTAAGCFVMVRQHHGEDRRPRQALLVVAPGVEVSPAPADAAAGGSLDWRWVGAATVIAAAVCVFVLRAPAAAAPRGPAALHASGPAPMDLSEALREFAGGAADGDVADERGPARHL